MNLSWGFLISQFGNSEENQNNLNTTQIDLKLRMMCT